MNKLIYRSFLRSFLAVFALTLLLNPMMAYAGDPIPGLDVKLGKNPGGALIATQTTGTNGTVIFTGLKPGERCLITFDAGEVQKMAIKEQGMPRAKGKSVTIAISFAKAAHVKADGIVYDLHENIDIQAAKTIEVEADDNGEVRATINTTRSNIR